MRKPKVEVGQMWKQDTYKDQITILTGFINGAEKGWVYLRRSHGLAKWSGGGILEQAILDNYTLIQNADGTPVKQWREVTAKELLLEGFSEFPLPCQVRDEDGEEWEDVELIGVSEFYGFEARKSFREHCRIEVKP